MVAVKPQRVLIGLRRGVPCSNTAPFTKTIGTPADLERSAQLAGSSVDLITSDPAGFHARIERPADEFSGQVRLGGELRAVRGTCVRAHFRVLGPRLRQVQRTVVQGMAKPGPA